MSAPLPLPFDRMPAEESWLGRNGRRAWWIVGLIVLIAMATYLTRMAAGIIGPLFFAIVLGVLFSPVVDWLERKRLPRAAATAVVMLGLVVVLAALGWLMVTSLSSQAATISANLQKGIDDAAAAVASAGIPAGTTSAVQSAIKEALPNAAKSAASILTSTISGTASLIFGTFMAFYMLFYILMDHDKLIGWIGRHMGLPEGLGTSIAFDSTKTVGQYFQGTTIVAAVTAAFTGIACVVLHVPLAGPITIITFATTYIPYVGVMIAGVFSCLIALAAGGVPLMLAMLAVVIIAQNFIEAPITGWAIGSALDIHPLVVIVGTFIGGIFFGIFGALLASPLIAAAVRASARIKAERVDA